MTSTTSADEIAKQFEAQLITKEADNAPANYNVAPTQDVLVVAEHRDDGRMLETMHWGLVPFFAKDKKTSARMINARADGVPDKPAFRRAFTKHRCIIPADGFYEWQKLDSKTKQPWYFHPKDGGLIAFAGLWEVWHDPNLPEDADPLFSVTIITTDANKDMEDVHDRMPLILKGNDIGEWLDRENTDKDDLRRLLDVQAPGYLDRYKISTDVNRVSNNGPELLEPLRA
jgi:putative SOS response-associated peptidase YedK